jgi:CheY-like chemotaxis protein
MRVLLVEDDMTAARGITMVMKSGSAVVDHADTGEEALELLRHYDYDVMILELALPDMEGFEVLRRMRAARNNTPVVALSASRSTAPSCWRASRRWSAAARGSASPPCGWGRCSSTSIAATCWFTASRCI